MSAPVDTLDPSTDAKALRRDASDLPHDSARNHVRGLSEFVDDRPPVRGELFVEVLYSDRARARIRKVDLGEAACLPGVVGVYTANDFHLNLWGTIFKDQPLLAESEVNFAGEGIAIVAAETREIARQARSLIRVEYEPLDAILSIDAAKAAKSFIGAHRKIERGNVEHAMKGAPHKLSGQVVIRGADHFYLESQVSIAYPREDGQIEVHSSSQHPTETQHVVAHAIGVPFKDVTCIVKRMGGGFGGKESQAAPFAAYAALVAHRTKRPARIALTKDDDMIMTGKRNPFQNDWKVGFDADGRILALDAELYSDGGAYADLSTSIMERAMLHIENAYYVPHLRVTGQVCRTNYHPHTAFRGFGGPKGVATIERIIEEIAAFLGKDPLDVRKLNCYTDEGGRNVTHYGQVVRNNLLPALFDRLEKSSDYRARRAEIDRENASALAGRGPNRLRGLSLTAVKFGISFTTRFLNQANALVIIHRDGSLQVSTGATEMGQGVNARIAELLARELGLPRSQVRVAPTSTDKNANTSPTAASSGTDLNGAAALLAVRKIKRRLSQLAPRLLNLPETRWAKHTAGLGTEDEITVDETLGGNDPNAGAEWKSGIATYQGIRFEDGFVFHATAPDKKLSFEELVNEAYHNRISLSDYAHYRIPGLSFNKLTGKGDAFLYFTQGTACSEISIDLDTGEVKVLGTDILMELGRPINEGLDLGQVTGAFIQGMGWVTTEKLFYDQGFLRAHSPSTYKIPSVQDTPRRFKVELLPNAENVANVRGTKAVGEPPLLLAISVWTAIHDALKGLPEYPRGKYPRMELPATQEEVLRAMLPARFARWEKP
jgi:xanthine dehydrogenase large subunit